MKKRLTTKKHHAQTFSGKDNRNAKKRIKAGEEAISKSIEDGLRIQRLRSKETAAAPPSVLIPHVSSCAENLLKSQIYKGHVPNFYSAYNSRKIGCHHAISKSDQINIFKVFEFSQMIKNINYRTFQQSRRESAIYDLSYHGIFGTVFSSSTGIHLIPNPEPDHTPIDKVCHYCSLVNTIMYPSVLWHSTKPYFALTGDNNSPLIETSAVELFKSSQGCDGSGPSIGRRSSLLTSRIRTIHAMTWLTNAEHRNELLLLSCGYAGVLLHNFERSDTSVVLQSHAIDRGSLPVCMQARAASDHCFCLGLRNGRVLQCDMRADGSRASSGSLSAVGNMPLRVDHMQTDWEEAPNNSHELLVQDVVGNLTLFDLRSVRQARQIHRALASRSTIRPHWTRARFLMTADASAVLAPMLPGPIAHHGLSLSAYSLRLEASEPLLTRDLLWAASLSSTPTSSASSSSTSLSLSPSLSVSPSESARSDFSVHFGSVGGRGTHLGAGFVNCSNSDYSKDCAVFWL